MLVDYLKDIPLFNHLKNAQLKEIAARRRNAGYKKGEGIFHKTDPSADLYTVNPGKLKDILIDEERGEMALAQFEKARSLVN